MHAASHARQVGLPGCSQQCQGSSIAIALQAGKQALPRLWQTTQVGFLSVSRCVLPDVSWAHMSPKSHIATMQTQGRGTGQSKGRMMVANLASKLAGTGYPARLDLASSACLISTQTACHKPTLRKRHHFSLLVMLVGHAPVEVQNKLEGKALPQNLQCLLCCCHVSTRGGCQG